MKSILNRIITLNIELEGALRVAVDRPSEEALDSAKSKFAEISALFAMLRPADFLAHAKPEPKSEPLPVREPEVHAPVDLPTEIKEEEAEGAEEDPLPELPVRSDDDEMLQKIVASYTEHIGMKAEKLEEDTPEAQEMSEDCKSTDVPASPRRSLADLRKMFTLNDKFMFRRELFGNDDEEFTATLELLASMQSFDEAEEYAYEDLRWDREAPRVKEFMQIVANHFG